MADDTTTGRPGFRTTGQTPFQAAGDRHALCVQPQRPGEVTTFVADPTGHPLDTGPIAYLDRFAVAQLVAALAEHLRGSHAPLPQGTPGCGDVSCACGGHRTRCRHGGPHTWTMPWMVDGRLMRDLDTGHCAGCGAAR